MYKRRLSNAAKVLSCLPEAGEYVIVLNEIEGPDVVEGLLFQQEMRTLGLHWYACTSKEGSPIQSAVVSSLPVTGARIHEVDGELRPVLEVELEAAGEKIFIFAVHFKSNVGGTAQTQEARTLAASVVNRIAQTVAMENPGALMLVCGDLNDECWENRTLGRDGEIRVSGTFGRDSWYSPNYDFVKKGNYVNGVEDGHFTMDVSWANGSSWSSPGYDASMGDAPLPSNIDKVNMGSGYDQYGNQYDLSSFADVYDAQQGGMSVYVVDDDNGAFFWYDPTYYYLAAPGYRNR